MALLGKRKFDEYQDVTSIDKRSSHAKVHAAVAQLSPVFKD